MGGLIRAPKPTPVASPAPPTPPPPPPPAPPPEQVASETRTATRQRSLRGRAGTIATSERGVLVPLPALARKTLLGE
ncbi:MAG: hypothetical protein K2X74_14995 [Acetobacteraceae bacterium]|nr:hypothetical protein [Acetobacteraceae bacterium]